MEAGQDCGGRHAVAQRRMFRGIWIAATTDNNEILVMR